VGVECLDIWLGTESGCGVEHPGFVGIKYPLAMQLGELADSCFVKSLQCCRL
jgi:hypothetical protein